MVFAFLRKNYIADQLDFPCGKFNGYVGLTPDELPLPNSFVGEDNPKLPPGSLDDYLEMHGGITFDEVGLPETWDPSDNIPLTEIPEDYEGCRIIGYDTCHCNSNSQMDFDWCRDHTLDLRDQVLELIGKK